MRRWGLPALLVVLVATPLWADVTVTSALSGKGGLATLSGGQTITYIKGTKWRSDTTIGDQPTSAIIDSGAKQMIVLNHKRKEAEVYDLAKLQTDVQKTLASVETKAELTPTGQTRELLGQPCAGYTLAITANVTMGSETLTMLMGGPVWIARSAPGAKEYAAFYKAAAQSGLFFESPQLAKAPGGQAKGRTEMYRLLAETGGIPYVQEIQIRFEGSGAMAGVMNKMGGTSITMTVTDVSTGPIADDLFSVPADYTARTR
jgi:hypothetical protein